LDREKVVTSFMDRHAFFGIIKRIKILNHVLIDKQKSYKIFHLIINHFSFQLLVFVYISDQFCKTTLKTRWTDEQTERKMGTFSSVYNVSVCHSYVGGGGGGGGGGGVGGAHTHGREMFACCVAEEMDLIVSGGDGGGETLLFATRCAKNDVLQPVVPCS
jgi:hypothetical protein